MPLGYEGTVRDKNGDFVANRTVRIIRESDQVCIETLTTDANGEFLSTVAVLRFVAGQLTFTAD